MTPLPRQAVRGARHLPDRMLHRWRQQRLLRWLERLPRVNSVLFICHGNICRSPYAAGVFEQRLPDAVRSRVIVKSAGFIGPGRSSPAEALRVAERHRVDLSLHRSELIAAESTASFDLIVVMDPMQARLILARFPVASRILVLGDLDPDRIATRSITDPWGQSEQMFDAVFTRIDRCIETLVSALYPIHAGRGAQTR